MALAPLAACICPICRRPFYDRLSRWHRAQRGGRQLCCSSTCQRQAPAADPTAQPPTVEIGAPVKFAAGRRVIPQLAPRSDLAAALHRVVNVTKARRHDSDLTTGYLEDLWLRQEGRCAISNIVLLLPGESTVARHPFTASLDRINSTRGYRKGNVRFVCLLANYARNSYSDEELITFCRAVVTHQGAAAPACAALELPPL